MSDVTRRHFVRSSAGAAAGVTAMGVLGVGAADAKRTATPAHPVVAWIGNPRAGRIRDHALAARIANAAR